MRFNLSCSGLALAFFAFLPSFSLLAQVAAPDPASDEEKAAAKQLLEDHWEGGTETKRAAEAAYENAVSNGVASEQVKWAFVVNQIHHGKYREALEVAEDLSAPAPHTWDASYARIWLALITQRTDQALTWMQHLAEALKADPNIDAQIRAAVARRLGRLYGYAESAAKVIPHPLTLSETLDNIQNTLDPNEFSLFEDYRQLVIDDYLDLSQQKMTALQEQSDQAMIEQQKEIEQLNAENVQIGQLRGTLEQQIAEIRQTANQELDKIRSQAEPLESEVRRTQSRMRSVSSELSWISQEIIALEYQAIHEPDPFIRAHLYRRINRLSADARVLDSELASLNAEYQDLTGQLSVIYVSRDQVISDTNSQLQGAQSELSVLNRTEKKNLRQLTRLRKPQVKTGLRRSLENKLHHLPTYDPFPAESFRTAILDALK